MKKQTLLLSVLVGILVIAGGLFAMNVLFWSVMVEPVVVPEYPTTAQSLGDVRKSSSNPKPTCTVSTDKKLYASAGPMHVTWTSTNASQAMFVEPVESFIDNPSAPVMLPSGTGSPVHAPRDAKAPQGSSTFNTSSVSNYEILLLKVTGPGGEGYCSASYYVGTNQNPAGSVPQWLTELPTSITFTLHSSQVLSLDRSLSILNVNSGYTSDAHGNVSAGHAIFLVTDKEAAFPVFVSTDVSPVVSLTSGKLRFSIAFIDGKLVLTLTPQQ